jgi:hypothetical protein
MGVTDKPQFAAGANVALWQILLQKSVASFFGR